MIKCQKHPKFKGTGTFPKRMCGNCKNLWMSINSEPGDLMTLFNSDGSPMGHSLKPRIDKNTVFTVGTASKIDFGYNSGGSAWVNSFAVVLPEKSERSSHHIGKK
jgi:hypothetical protein